VTSVRTLTLPALVAAAVLLAGCSGGGAASTASDAHAGHTMTSSQPSTSSKPAQVMTVQQLAATLGCQATVSKAADYRQARCTAAGTDFVLLDFDTAEGQRAWLDLAVAYGGVYLVGNRWALSGKSKEYLETLRNTLGGTIEENRSHG
jgi:hypothetical protein